MAGKEESGLFHHQHLHLILQGGVLTEFDETGDELTGTTEATRCSSDVSALINHYRAFSNTLQANSAIGVIEQNPQESPVVKDAKTKAGLVPAEVIAPEPVPGNIAVQEQDANNIPTGLFVIIPTRNNELGIGSLVHLCRRYAESVIVVDEDSDDRTREITTDAGTHLVRINPDGGIKRAMFVGFQVAHERGCSAVVMYDSEGIFRARIITALVADVMNGTADLVIGSRFLKGRKGIQPY